MESCVCIKNYKSIRGNFNKGEKYLFEICVFQNFKDTHLVYFDYIGDRVGYNYCVFSIVDGGMLVSCFSEHFEIITEVRKRKLNMIK
jgi:hypothetical protein